MFKKLLNLFKKHKLSLKSKGASEFYDKYNRLPKSDKELSMFILFGSVKGEK